MFLHFGVEPSDSCYILHKYNYASHLYFTINLNIAIRFFFVETENISNYLYIVFLMHCSIRLNSSLALFLQHQFHRLLLNCGRTIQTCISYIYRQLNSTSAPIHMHACMTTIGLYLLLFFCENHTTQGDLLIFSKMRAIREY